MKRARVALLLIPSVAGVLRFTALGQGLRHEPHMDERYFVENASRMWSEGSLDHGFYEYPRLLFFFLAPVVGIVNGGEPPGPEAYLAARAFLAACGVLTVALAARFAAAFAGPVAGLVAAALPPTRDQLEDLGFSEMLVFEQVVAEALRVGRTAGRRRWSVAELRVSR